MSLETTLSDITARLRQGKFPNEQAISQGIVLRVFQELGWDTWDTHVVWPEYQTGEGRADFALCHPPSKPAVFIEVKQPGKAEEAVRQALEYAFHTGVPFVGLTDAERGVSTCQQNKAATRTDVFTSSTSTSARLSKLAKSSNATSNAPKLNREKRWKLHERNTAAAIDVRRPKPLSRRRGASW